MGAFTVNLNMVHPYVLEVIISSLSGTESDKQKLLQAVLNYRSSTVRDENNQAQERKQVFNTQDMQLNTFMDLLQLDRNMLTRRNLTAQFLRYAAAVTEFYAVRVESPINEKKSYVTDMVLGPRIVSRSFSGGLRTIGRAGNLVAMPLEVLS